MNLKGLHGNSLGCLRGDDLGHSMKLGVVEFVMVSSPSGLPVEEPRSLKFNEHIGQHRPDELMFNNASAPLHSRLGILKSSLIGSSSHSYIASRCISVTRSHSPAPNIEANFRFSQHRL